MPIISPSEYPALKAQGLIHLAKLPDGRIRVTINRGEQDDYSKAAILTWLAGERKSLSDQITILDTIKSDIDPL